MQDSILVTFTINEDDEYNAVLNELSTIGIYITVLLINN